MTFDPKETDGGLGHVTCVSGDIKENEYVDFYHHLYKELGEFPKHRLYGLSDFTAVSSFDVSAQAIRTVANEFAKISAVYPDAIVAVVADFDLMFGLEPV